MLDTALKIAWLCWGTPYRWGGDDFSSFDCSGFICEILKSVGLIGRNEDYTAQGLWDKFKDKRINIGVDIRFLNEGVLVFWGESETKITHIEMSVGGGRSIGASGGGSKTLSLQDSIDQNAWIKVRPIRSRKDIVGFISLFE